MMTATPALILRGQFQELGDYTQGESVTPGAGPGLRVQIGARQVVVPLDREQLQALALRPDQEVELVIRPLSAAPAAAPSAPASLFHEGNYSFRTPAGEVLTGSAAERAAMIYARRELHALVHEVLGMRRRAEDGLEERVWWLRLWALLELLVILTRACPFCGNDPHKESCPPNLNADELALLRQIQAAGEAGYQFHEARAKKPLRRAMSSLLQESLVCADASLTERKVMSTIEDEDVGQRLRLTLEGEQFLASLPPAVAGGAAPAVRTRSAVGRQSVPDQRAALRRQGGAVLPTAHRAAAEAAQGGGAGCVVGGDFLAFTLLLVLHLWRVWPAQVLPPFEMAVDSDPAPTSCLGAAL